MKRRAVTVPAGDGEAAEGPGAAARKGRGWSRGRRIEAPRKTLFEVEREKRWRIWVLFGLLLALAFVTAWVACLIVSILAYFAFPESVVVAWLFTLRGVLVVLGAALVFSLLYWGLAQLGARGRLVAALHCRPLDPGDRYHERLANIVEEMRIATGGPRIECVTVRTVGFNAFAFSDLHGGGVIGVTEGALARLSRQELQAVVAHEFAHILSGSYVTVTVSCLLFGIYSSLVDDIDEASRSGRGHQGGVGGRSLMVPLRTWLWLMQLASSVVSSAISRERERQADLAAVRYTRDPLALAEALRVIGRHPGGAGYIPEGLAPLCIRATGTLGWPAVAWRDTHPPLEERISTLLGVAHVAPAEFERQVAQAGEDFDRTGSTGRRRRAGAAAGSARHCSPPPLRTAVAPGSGGRRRSRVPGRRPRALPPRRQPPRPAQPRPRRRPPRRHDLSQLRRRRSSARPTRASTSRSASAAAAGSSRRRRSASCWRGAKPASRKTSSAWPTCCWPAATACAAPPSSPADAPASRSSPARSAPCP